MTTGMEFFCYHRDRPGSAALRDELLEQHWAYMDRCRREARFDQKSECFTPRILITFMYTIRLIS
jgi:hypothetical protein